MEQTAEECYNKALEYKNQKNWNDYCRQLTISAGMNYQSAINTWDSELDISTTIGQDFNISQIIFYKETAKKGNIYSIHYLAIMYRYGHGVIKNTIQSIQLYNEAMNGGNLRSIHCLAYIYECGLLELPIDLNKASNLYELSFVKGYRGTKIDKILYLYNKLNIKVNYENLVKQCISYNNISRIVGIFEKIILFPKSNLSPELLKILFTIDPKEYKMSELLEYIRHIHRSQIDLIELHFQYAPTSEGYAKAKEDYIIRMLDFSL
jgi:TPR repeat protein